MKRKTYRGLSCWLSVILIGGLAVCRGGPPPEQGGAASSVPSSASPGHFDKIITTTGAVLEDVEVKAVTATTLAVRFKRGNGVRATADFGGGKIVGNFPVTVSESERMERESEGKGHFDAVLPFSILDESLQKQYNYDPKKIEEAQRAQAAAQENQERLAVERQKVLQAARAERIFDDGLAYAREDHGMTLTLDTAFRLSQLEEAKKKAIREKKPLGFVMVWDQFFNQEGKPMTAKRDGGVGSTLHFYQAFKDSCVLVFVRHENEISGVPASVMQGFAGPDEGGFAPNMAVVNEDASEFICEIPLGGGQNTTGATRDAVFREKIKVIKEYYSKKKNAASAVPADQKSPNGGK